MVGIRVEVRRNIEIIPDFSLSGKWAVISYTACTNRIAERQAGSLKQLRSSFTSNPQYQSRNTILDWARSFAGTDHWPAYPSSSSHLMLSFVTKFILSEHPNGQTCGLDENHSICKCIINCLRIDSTTSRLGLPITTAPSVGVNT